MEEGRCALHSPKQLRLASKRTDKRQGSKGIRQAKAAVPFLFSGSMKMSDSFTETTSVSWFGRLRRSVGGVVIGLLLIIGMVVLLFWNEGRAVTTARSLAEGAGAVVSVGADAVDAANEGKLIHVSGTVTTDSTPEDPDFAISATGVRLVRNVEMFQWKEESHSETTQEAGRRRGNHHHLHLFQGMGRQPDRFGRVQAALRTPEPVDGCAAAAPSRSPRASSARSRSTSRCSTGSAATSRWRSSRTRSAAIEAAYWDQQEGQRRRRAHLSGLEPVVAGDRRLPRRPTTLRRSA